MATFVHLTSEKSLKSILRNGIKAGRLGYSLDRGFYAVPVTPNFFVTHQWLRELRRWGRGHIIGVYFRIPDTAEVLIRGYGRGPSAYEPRSVTAAQAVALFAATENALGAEVIVPWSVSASGIVKIRHLRQVVGWRYSPASHGNKPMLCLECERGIYGIQKIVRRIEEAEAKGKDLGLIVFSRPERSVRRVDRLKKKHAEAVKGRLQRRTKNAE